ncbi:cytochrome c biogenesis protein CcsA [Flagellimonas aequoris]|uniref:Cytochrome C biogenesis protein n=1 Tax=Flagellimonas aequoris TaxID=2306997 RepID=A0A418N881_9FLAO|nr:cytochrome c biogenesis protein CcsA [Allomuricauda aequoris]RIV71133.1 cytochrome C biogenesis protein [Allomuricauda aequoris]TXK02508.1 cytochrome C biogenesis protein [Allomuricauda aequoris]
MQKLSIAYVKKAFLSFFGTKAATIYIALFALSIGVATFIENDFGTSSAQKYVYKTGWFELLLLLFAGSIIYNIIQFRMIQQRKWALFLFHAAILVILLGAFITRYFSYEGVMHIREHTTSNSFLSSDSYLKFKVRSSGQDYDMQEPVLFASMGKNKWKESYLVDNHLINIELKEFVPNPVQKITSGLMGKPTLKLVVAGNNGREEYFLTQGENKRIGSVLYNFSSAKMPNAFNIDFRDGQLMFDSNKDMTVTVMATQTRDTILAHEPSKPLQLRALYSDGTNNVVFPEFNENASTTLVSASPKVRNDSQVAILLNVSVDGAEKEVHIYGNRGYEGKPEIVNFDGTTIAISYGSKTYTVPFYVRLNDFIMDKYPGTSSASSYASEVTLLDESNQVNMDFRIYMNHILNYKGYRFFQSSFDRDEQGTYLSVNHDFWGTTISYLGYALLTLGMIMTLFSKKSRFYELSQKIRKIRSKSVLLFLLLFGTSVFAQNRSTVAEPIQKEHAQAFSKLVVQDYKGRMKPMHTLSREILRKTYRKESFDGLNADQVILGMFSRPQEWYHKKLIKLGEHKEIQKKISTGGGYASYADFFDQAGKYKLNSEVQRAYGMDPADRGTFEKELLKIDERVNILNMVFSGTLLRLVPDPDNSDMTWLSAHTHQSHGNEATVSDRFFTNYKAALNSGLDSGNYADADKLVSDLKEYQIQKGGTIVPSDTKISLEILLNQMNIFTRLAIFYILMGLVLLFFLFLSVFKPQLNLKKIHAVLLVLVVVGFVFHTVGLGLRWYVSGRAPWSNGYESMIYIGWTSTLAGLLFTRKSLGGLSATMVLAAIIHFVATLSFLDPEITPLVPVLKSYWLTIHVSLEAGSYGFLMLGAIIGLINLILMLFLNKSNLDRIKKMITEMSYISEMTLIGGLFMVSIGTYLGGVWANESWGRYWGWDAKETWALVTILVYAFILHMRLVPQLKGLFAYNLATIFGLSSVIMTYYGVNYYLSGLHSYATGDPVPIPTWVYIVVASITLISIGSYLKKRKFPEIS